MAVGPRPVPLRIFSCVSSSHFYSHSVMASTSTQHVPHCLTGGCVRYHALLANRLLLREASTGETLDAFRETISSLDLRKIVSRNDEDGRSVSSLPIDGWVQRRCCYQPSTSSSIYSRNYYRKQSGVTASCSPVTNTSCLSDLSTTLLDAHTEHVHLTSGR